MEQQHPFIHHKSQFDSIHEDERSNYRRKILDLQPMIGQPKLFKTQYQNHANWEFKGVQLNYYFIKKNDNPKAIFFSFHGLNSHGGSSGYLGTNISQKCKINVYALDFKNFGMSGGDQRGYIPSFEESLEQAEKFVDYILSQYKNKPKVIISGLSFGGTICFKLAALNPQKYDYLILFSPGLREVKQSLPVLKKVGKLMGYLFPTWQIIEPKFTDGNKYNMQKFIRGDKNNYTGKIVPGSIRTVLNAIQSVQTEYSKLKTPYLLIQSGTDKLVDLFAPLDLEKQCQTKDHTTVYCKDMWHSVYSEQEIEHITPLVCSWINKRV